MKPEVKSSPVRMKNGIQGHHDLHNLSPTTVQGARSHNRRSLSPTVMHADDVTRQTRSDVRANLFSPLGSPHYPPEMNLAAAHALLRHVHGGSYCPTGYGSVAPGESGIPPRCFQLGSPYGEAALLAALAAGGGGGGGGGGQLRLPETADRYSTSSHLVRDFQSLLWSQSPDRVCSQKHSSNFNKRTLDVHRNSEINSHPLSGNNLKVFLLLLLLILLLLLLS